MDKKMKYLLFALGVLILFFGINKIQQNYLQTANKSVFDCAREDVYGIQITRDQDTLALNYDGTLWHIANHDSLEVKTDVLDRFFEQIFSLKQTSLISKNKEKWDTYQVGDSTGAHLLLTGLKENDLGKITIGRSGAQWSVNNIRIAEKPNVYQTNLNVAALLNSSPTYWGQIPAPPTADTTAVANTQN